eukprot:m51a1_g11713 hypothetical protein (346) ;mRNA; f:73905-75249
MPKFALCVHAGAGYHSPSRAALYTEALRQALAAGAESLRGGGSALDGVEAAVRVLEDCPHTNAGIGSNLNDVGHVECDASAMTSDGEFGCVGAISGVRNPVSAAAALLRQRLLGPIEPLGLIRPAFLVGSGATQWALANGAVACDLVTAESRARWQEHSARRAAAEAPASARCCDTVGAVALAADSTLAAAVSSGGPSLKPSGRVAEAGHYGSGCWAAPARRRLRGVAVSTTGIGEQLMGALLAVRVGEALQERDADDDAVSAASDVFGECFVGRNRAVNEPQLGGFVSLRTCGDEDAVEAVVGHTTMSLAFGTVSSASDSVVRISRMRAESQGRSCLTGSLLQL